MQLADALKAKPAYNLVENKADRLRFLAAFLKTVPEKQFYMEMFHTNCGTRHCAYGWAEQIPAFQKLEIPSSREAHIVSKGAEFFGLTTDDWYKCFAEQRTSGIVTIEQSITRLQETATAVAEQEKRHAA